MIYFTSDYDYAAVRDPSDAPVPQLDGMAIAQRIGCFDCHTVTGSKLVGPTWLGLIGRERTFEDGTSLIADVAYVRQSIYDPQLHIVQGFPPVMTTTYAERLSDPEIEAIIAYIQTLTG